MLDEKDLQYLAEMEKRIDARMTEMADEARRGAVHDMQVIIENTIMPSLKLLAEGQRTLLETMAPKTRVEQLEAAMQHLQAVVPSQSARPDELETRLACKTPSPYRSINSAPFVRPSGRWGLFAARTGFSESQKAACNIPARRNILRAGTFFCSNQRLSP